jgi:hypothetical protein
MTHQPDADEADPCLCRHCAPSRLNGETPLQFGPHRSFAQNRFAAGITLSRPGKANPAAASQQSSRDRAARIAMLGTEID